MFLKEVKHRHGDRGGGGVEEEKQWLSPSGKGKLSEVQIGFPLPRTRAVGVDIRPEIRQPAIAENVKSELGRMSQSITATDGIIIFPSTIQYFCKWR